MNRRECLETAATLVSADRNKSYGEPGENFRRIAALWEPILGVEVSPEQVALCLMQVKAARLIASPRHKDSWIDLAGYAACGAEVSNA